MKLLKGIMFLMIMKLSLAYSFTDDSGQKVSFDKPYKRIISLYGAHTEILMDIGASGSLIGVDKSNAGKGKEVFNYGDSIEKYIKAKPDLVLIRPMILHRYKGLIKGLRAANIKIITIKPTSFQDLETYWKRLGIITGHEKEANEYTYNFEKQIKEIKDKTSKIPENEIKSVFFEARHKGGIKTTSKKGIPSYILEVLNINNIASDAKDGKRGSTVVDYPKELLLTKGQNIDYYISQRGPMNKITREQLLKTPGFNAIKAIREGNIYIVDEDKVSRPTIGLLEGLKEVGKIIYPKYF